MKWNRSSLLFIFLIASILQGCSSVPVNKNEVPPIPDFLVTQKASRITSLGDSDHPRFSGDSTRLLFESRLREPHKGKQIYEADLLKNKDRRVVFSDGDAFDASYINDYEILYSSTTDEIKEDPLDNKVFPQDYPPAELYMSDLFGNDILRLTQRPGYDGEAVYLPDPIAPFILFSSQRTEKSGIFRLNLQGLTIREITNDKDKEYREATVSPDQRMAVWTEKDTANENHNLILYDIHSKAQTPLKQGEGVYQGLFFSPRPDQRLYYSILRPGSQYYRLEVYDIKTNCTQVVLEGPASLYSPATSNEADEKLAFSVLQQENKQLYIMNLPSNLGPCLESPAQDKLIK